MSLEYEGPVEVCHFPVDKREANKSKLRRGIICASYPFSSSARDDSRSIANARFPEMRTNPDDSEGDHHNVSVKSDLGGNVCHRSIARSVLPTFRYEQN